MTAVAAAGPLGLLPAGVGAAADGAATSAASGSAPAFASVLREAEVAPAGHEASGRADPHPDAPPKAEMLQQAAVPAPVAESRRDATSQAGSAGAKDGAGKPAKSPASASDAAQAEAPAEGASDAARAERESRGKAAVDVPQPADTNDATPPDLALMLSQLMQKAEGSGTTPVEAGGAGAPGIEAVGARRPAAPGTEVRGRSAAVVKAAPDAPAAAVPVADPVLANLDARPAVAPAVAPALPGGRPATLPVVQTPVEAANASGTATWQTRMLGQALGDHRPVPEVARAPHAAATPAPAPTTLSLAAQEAQAPSQAAALHATTQVAHPAADAASAQPVPTAATLSPDFASAWQRVEQPDDDGPSAGSGAAIPGGWQAPGAPDLGATLPVTSPSATAEAGSAFRDASEALLDQVSWWAAQQTQGAQLTVAGPGDAPVSVQLRLQGQEAQVLFQSDDRQARQLIHQSLPQLEQMLAGQGLSLGSASVGTGPGQGGGQGLGAQAQAQGQGQGSSGQGAERGDARAAAPPATRVAAAGRPGASGRGALDLFV